MQIGNTSLCNSISQVWIKIEFHSVLDYHFKLRIMKAIIISLATITLFISCQKEKDPESRTSILTEKAWKFVKIESKTNNGPWLDEVQYQPACVKDNEMLFKANLSYVLSEGATKCDPFDPDIMEEARWSFLENETKIDIDGAILFIEKLNDSQFIISASETIGNDTFYERYTLEH